MAGDLFFYSFNFNNKMGVIMKKGLLFLIFFITLAFSMPVEASMAKLFLKKDGDVSKTLSLGENYEIVDLKCVKQEDGKDRCGYHAIVNAIEVCNFLKILKKYEKKEFYSEESFVSKESLTGALNSRKSIFKKVGGLVQVIVGRREGVDDGGDLSAAEMEYLFEEDGKKYFKRHKSKVSIHNNGFFSPGDSFSRRIKNN